MKEKFEELMKEIEPKERNGRSAEKRIEGVCWPLQLTGSLGAPQRDVHEFGKLEINASSSDSASSGLKSGAPFYTALRLLSNNLLCKTLQNSI